MNRYLSFVLPGLLLVVASLLASSCGGSAQQGESEPGGAQESKGEMAGMDMGSGEMASPEGLIIDGEYSDGRFIDKMAAHHQMAIDMAEVARKNAELPEIRRIADDVVTHQQSEIDEFGSIKDREFGSSEVPTMMNPEEPSMNAMLMPDELAEQEPFDRAFIDSMIPHHASAIEMASTALIRSDDPDIRRLSRGIVDAQSQEIGEMIELRQQYYPEG